MKFEIDTKISLQGEIDPNHLHKILEPENSTPDQTEIESHVEDNKVITAIKGKMSIRTLLRSIDDIVQTAILSSNVSSTLDEEDIPDQTQ